MTGYPIAPTVSAIGILALCALAVVLVSRVSRIAALLVGLATYACVLFVMSAFGIRAVATAWVAMAAAMSLIYAIGGRSIGSGGGGGNAGAGSGSDRTASLVPSMIASFVVGLIGWPFVFPGIHVTDSVRTKAVAPSQIAASSGDDDDDDDDESGERLADDLKGKASYGKMLADRPGAASVTISDGSVVARATQSAPAELRAPLGIPGTWPEDRTASFSLAIVAGGGSIDALGVRGEVVSRVAVRGSETFDRDRWYELGAAFGRAYEGGMRVDDSLEGLNE